MTNLFHTPHLRRPLSLLAATLLSVAAMAQEAEATIDTGDTTFLIVATAAVLLMTPALALFYSGMVRRKNVLATMMQSIFAMGVISLQWVLIGYSLAFGPSIGTFIGDLSRVGLRGVGMEAMGSVPHYIFMAFQMMFAIVTAAIVFGGVAERMKFKAYLVYILLWSTFVYAPLAHWVWGGGLLAPGHLFKWLGFGESAFALDFAGGLVVHISSGLTALIAALVIGRRIGYPKEPMPPHNLTLTVIGTGLLWFGWFFFNAGSALAANGVATLALINTNTAAAAGMVSWTMIEWIKTGKPTVLGALSGAVAGLVVVTPACGFVTPMASVIMGLLVGVVCYGAVSLRYKLGYDESLDAFGVHGVGGALGAILVGIFATTSVNPAGADGLLAGNPSQLLVQIISVVVTYAFVGIMAFVLLKITAGITGGLRISKEAEMEGMDLAEHGESGYNLGDIPLGHGVPAPAATTVTTTADVKI